MTTLIIGGTGFIGRRLIPLLAKQGEDSVVMDINPQTANFSELAKVRVLRGDVSQFDDGMAAVTAVKPDRVINLAYYISSDLPPRVAFKLNILGMDNCFEAARLAGCNRVVYASSVAVSGEQKFYGEHRQRRRFQARPPAIRDAQDFQRVAGAGLPRKARYGDHDDPSGQCDRPGQGSRFGRPRFLHHASS